MKHNAIIFLFLLFLVLLIPSISLGQYVVGDTVGDFTLNDVDGNQVSLYDYMGQVVLLNFYATW